MRDSEVSAEAGARRVHHVVGGGDLGELVLQFGDEGDVLLAPLVLRHVAERAGLEQGLAVLAAGEPYDARVPAVVAVQGPAALDLGDALPLEGRERGGRRGLVVGVDVLERQRAVEPGQLVRRRARHGGERRAHVVEAAGAQVEPVEAVHRAVQRVAQAALGLPQGAVRPCAPHLRPGPCGALGQQIGLVVRPLRAAACRRRRSHRPAGRPRAGATQGRTTGRPRPAPSAGPRSGRCPGPAARAPGRPWRLRGPWRRPGCPQAPAASAAARTPGARPAARLVRLVDRHASGPELLAQ